MQYAIILAGGSGSRLWPLSRSLLPKHLLSPLGGHYTLLQQTAKRLLSIASADCIITVTHEDHRFEALRQLKELSPSLRKVLAEPFSRNTLPAISWAVMQIATQDPEAMVGVFPSDHLILDEKAFQDSFEKAVQAAAQGHLVTFGITPTGPQTGYGYIQTGSPIGKTGAYNVLSFVEKPDQDTAISYLKKGNYYWNSGMFVFKASDFLAELQMYEPEIWKTTSNIVNSGNNPSIIRDLYKVIKSISIDNGIMEKSNRISIVPAKFPWNDLGSWETIYQQMKKDTNSNVIQGNVLTIDSDSSLLISRKGLMATIGIKDSVVIQTEDAVLISARNRVQDVKKIVEMLKASSNPLAESHSTVLRPWGQYSVLEQGKNFKIKKIVVNQGQKLSLQRHEHRAEHWVVIEGTARVTCGDKTQDIRLNESTFIPQGEKHRLENPGDTPLVIIEVQTGSYVGEDDIQRFDDIYGRTADSSLPKMDR